MPKGKGYKMKIGKGATRTPKSVMGNQGKSIKIKPSHKSRPTKTTKFPE